MSPLSSELLTRALDWANSDPDPATEAELRALIAVASLDDSAGDATMIAQAEQELQDAFAGTLQFGTAGLRAALGPGPNRMNRIVVRRAAAGLASFLLATAAAAAEPYRPRAVVGFDARHNSDVFALETAAIFTAAGIETFLMPSALPTPLLAFAVRALGCEGGVMVTASHNPPQDNGYKVYLGGRALAADDESGRGAQIVAPYDSQIAARIDAVGPVESIRLAQDGWQPVAPEIIAAYRQGLVELLQPERFSARELKIVLTPMHGVGGETALQVFEAAGFTDVTVVSEQAAPDPNFPTVAFPNPEEPGALDLAIQTATEVGADLVIANDPDADRAAVAGVDPSTGQWRMLRGDEVGALLGAHVVARAKTDDEPRGVFANSIVSSRLLAKIATANGFAHVETLTGFKWIARVPGLSYGYEEALGYCVAPSLVRDKDGISAGLLIAEMAAAAKATGRTLFDLLDDLAVRNGLHVSDQLSVRVADLGLLSAMMNRLREHTPTSFAGSAVEAVTDLATGSAQLPATDGMLYLTKDSTRVIIRPSGTEPKLKCYLEVIVPVDSAADLSEARKHARSVLDAVLDDVREALGL